MNVIMKGVPDRTTNHRPSTRLALPGQERGPFAILDMRMDSYRDLLLPQSRIDEIARACVSAEDEKFVQLGPFPPLGSIRLYVEDDPVARKSKALMFACDSNSEVAYEDADGCLRVAKPIPRFKLEEMLFHPDSETDTTPRS